jgi:hypothetical protein
MITKITSKRSLWCLVNVPQWRSAPSASTEYMGTLNHPNICHLCGTWTLWIGQSLVACTLALLRIDFVKTNPIIETGLGPNIDVISPGMHCETVSFPLIFCIFIFRFACSRSMGTRVFGMYVLMISRSNGMDARIAGPMSSCTTAPLTALGCVPFASRTPC